MNSGYDYAFLDPSRLGKLPYIPKRKKNVRLPPLGRGSLELGAHMEGDSFEEPGQHKRRLFSYETQDVSDYDLHDMKPPKALGELVRYPKVLEANLPTNRKRAKTSERGDVDETLAMRSHSLSEMAELRSFREHGTGKGFSKFSANFDSDDNSIASPSSKSVHFQLNGGEAASGPKKPVIAKRGYQSLTRKAMNSSASDTSPLAAISSRLPYLKDVILGDNNPSNLLIQQATSLLQLSQKTPSPSASQADNAKLSSAPVAKVAPDDEEEISKLKTGEDAVAFFSRAGKNTAVKFVHLNRADSYPSFDSKDFQPYQLVVVPREEINPEYYTMSASGVAHIQPGQPSEIISLADWMRESTMFTVLRRISFFKQYLVQKCFKIWYKNARYKRFCKTRAQLGKRFFHAKQTFLPSLLKIHHLCHSLQDIPIMDFGQTSSKKLVQNTYEIAAFQSNQSNQRQSASKEFDQVVDAIEEILTELCDKVTASSQVPEMTSDNIEAYLKGTLSNQQIAHDDKNSKKSKSMVEMQQDEIRRRQALKKAKEEADMLGDFIRIADYMAAESLITLAKNTVHNFYGIMHLQKLIKFRVQLSFRGEDSMLYKPQEQDILDVLRKNSDDIVQVVNVVPRLLYMRPFKVYFQSDRPGIVDDEVAMKQWFLGAVIHSDEVFNTSRDNIEKLVHSNWLQVLDYGREVEALKKWYIFARRWNAQEYASRTHTVSEFTGDINKVTQALNELKRTKNQENDIAILFPESKELQNELTEELYRIEDNIKLEIGNTLKTMCSKLHSAFNARRKTLDERPTKLEQFAQFVESLNAIRAEQLELMSAVEELDSMYDLAKIHRVTERMRPAETVEIEDMPSVKSQFLKSVRDAETFKDTNLQERTEELDRYIQQANSEMLKIINLLGNGEYVAKTSSMEDIITILGNLDELEKELVEIEQRTQEYTKQQVLFNITNKPWTNLQDAKAKFQTRKSIWSTLKEFMDKTEMWNTTSVNDLDAESIEKEVQGMFKLSSGFVKENKEDEVSLYLKQEVQRWRENLTVVMMVANKDLKPRHWESIIRNINDRAIIPATLDLRFLDSIDIFEHRDMVAEISSMASGEADLNKMIDKVESQWSDTEFVIQSYKEKKGVYILGSVEEITQQLEDNQAQLQTMQASPFIMGVKAKIDDWDRKLTTVSETIEAWLTCQKNWMNLEYIFSSEDIKRQLHEESAQFGAVDKDFKDLMIKTNANKNVIQACTDDNVLSMLAQCNQNLEDVQKRLEDYLEQNSDCFPNFLSNEELLEILSQTRRVVIKKSPEERERLREALASVALFNTLEDEDLQVIFDAMFERKCKAGDCIMKQGDAGDNFYVVDSGECDIFVQGPSQTDTPHKVLTVGPGGTFGELALMFGVPRAATIVAQTDCRLWALDRMTYRRIIMQQSLKKRNLYENFLSRVQILQTLTPYERLTVADALQPQTYGPGETIVRQGDHGDKFYIIVEGEARVTKTVDGGQEVELTSLKQSDYFGELALLYDQPRAATVVAVGQVKVVCLDRRSFKKLLGPCEELLKRNTQLYSQYVSRAV